MSVVEGWLKKHAYFVQKIGSFRGELIILTLRTLWEPLTVAKLDFNSLNL